MPIKYNFVRLASSLVPKQIVEWQENLETDSGFWLMGFALLRKFHPLLLTKQSSSTTTFKNLKHCNQFSGFDYQSDCLDSFMGRALACLLVNFHSLLWPRFCRRTVSVNKDLVDTNIKEKSLISQRLIYDKIVSDYVGISFLVILPKLRKSCMLASQRYK